GKLLPARLRKNALMHGISYCKGDGGAHSFMQGRDRSAALNIGALFLAQQRQLDLGPWQRRLVDGTPAQLAADAKRDERAQERGSTVLRDTLE
ncbi:hypothetical protein M3M33_13805, partial [Loigolactobacillus coryniformis]|uniref:hypothetical protein n=1 Tax=Loigolactobacillus coryniformis TaxID=1610 RepID=UPI00201A8FFF